MSWLLSPDWALEGSRGTKGLGRFQRGVNASLEVVKTQWAQRGNEKEQLLIICLEWKIFFKWHRFFMGLFLNSSWE